MQIRRICLIRIAASKAHDDVRSGIYIGFFQRVDNGDKWWHKKQKEVYRSIAALNG